jgi:uncharacterized protein YecE (DUF72 family)
MIRVGIGGFAFAPWRGTFYPDGLPQAQELAYASRRLTSIEINATFYRTQSPASFRRWREQTPDGFVFSLKGPRSVTHRRALEEVAPSIERFLTSGILELGDKLGPLLWQFPKTMRFNAATFAAFLALLPAHIDRRPLRHVVEVGHPSFVTPQFLTLMRAHRVAVAIIDSEDHPMFEEMTADFVYARLRRTAHSEPSGYSPAALDAWATRLRRLARSGEGIDPQDQSAGPSGQRDCFVYFISGAKVRAPTAAQALLERLSK